MRKLSGFLLCVLTMFTVIGFKGDASAVAVIEGGCVPNFSNYQQPKPDVRIKERDNGRGEATILVPVANDDKSWWEFWKSDYVYKEAKMPTKDLPEQTKPWWQFW